MVKSYDGRHNYHVVKLFLSENACFLNFFYNMKVKLVDEMMLSAYKYVILHVKQKK